MEAPESSVIKDIALAIVASSTVVAAMWGAAGGATSAIVIQTDRASVIRQVLAGALIAAGAGGAGGFALSVFFNLPHTAIPVTAGASAIPYFLGVFGPAVIEHRLRKWRTANTDEAPQSPPAAEAPALQPEVTFDGDE